MLNRVAAAAALALALSAAGCVRRASDARAAHRNVACAGCHRERPGSATRSGVPDAACSTERCHPTGGPERAQVRTVAFTHLRHPADANGHIVPCAGCHVHSADSSSFAAGAAACVLCHYRDIAGSSDSGCVKCHPNPRHSGTTSQGLQLPHAALREAHVPCTRCHFRLLDGRPEAARARCTGCHEPRPARSALLSRPDSATAPRDTILSADSAHAAHRTISCRACHERVSHRVVAMSSAIDLSCPTCHSLRHRPAIAADSAPDSTCGNCHAGVHRDEQRMILGLLPGDSARPSVMFMGGVTCQSCHVTENQPAPRPGTALRGTPAACTGCHGGAWQGVLDRWRRGYVRRRDMVAGYVGAARAAVADSSLPPAARARVREADALLEFAAKGGPLHNLPLTDRMLRRALSLAGDAYRVAKRPAPAPPALGPSLADNRCLSCHYGIEEARIGVDSTTGRPATHAPHVFGSGLSCAACHAVGAAPPGFAGRTWDTSAARRRPAARP
jgi:hypothetical protein